MKQPPAICRGRSEFPNWLSFSAELLNFNFRVATDIVGFWRDVAEVQVAAFMALVARETPTSRRRKFLVITGGKN
jgi:hypothetical protein